MDFQMQHDWTCRGRKPYNRFESGIEISGGLCAENLVNARHIQACVRSKNLTAKGMQGLDWRQPLIRSNPWTEIAGSSPAAYCKPCEHGR